MLLSSVIKNIKLKPSGKRNDNIKLTISTKRVIYRLTAHL